MLLGELTDILLFTNLSAFAKFSEADYATGALLPVVVCGGKIFLDVMLEGMVAVCGGSAVELNRPLLTPELSSPSRDGPSVAPREPPTTRRARL